MIYAFLILRSNRLKTQRRDFVMKSAFPCKKTALFARFYFLHISKHKDVYRVLINKEYAWTVEDKMKFLFFTYYERSCV